MISFNLARLAPLLFLAMWSSGALFVKAGLQDSSVLSFLLVRSLGALLVMTILLATLLPAEIRGLLSMPRPAWLRLLFVGLFLQVLYQGFFFASIAHDLSPGMLAIVLGCQPLLTPVLALERIGGKGYLVLLLGFVGLVIAVTGGGAVDAVTVSGLTFAGLSVLAMTVGTILQKHTNVNVMSSVLVQYCLSSIIFALGVGLYGFDAELTSQFIFSALWMIVVVSVGAVLLLVYMLKGDKASKVSALFFLVPVITYLLDYLVYDAPLSLLTILGGAMVVSSLLIYGRVIR
ncbi:hypothetical protein EHLJMEHL_02761 [Vreelandella titanicae]